MIDHNDWLLAWRERDLEQQRIEYERELEEELESDWANDRLRIYYEQILEALGISSGSATIHLTDKQHDDGLTQDELEELLLANGIHLTRQQREKLTKAVLTFYWHFRYE